MIKAILFDLDGVLVDADKWHFDALNSALRYFNVDPISWEEHLSTFKGIPTKKKLQLLSEQRDLPRELWPLIHTAKQDITREMIERFCVPNTEKIEMLRSLKRKFRIGVCSNAIRASIHAMLSKSGMAGYMDLCLSYEDATAPKPAPEIYLKAFAMLGIKPHECVIVEDSETGALAAQASGAFVCRVSGPAMVNYYRVLHSIQEAERVNVVIPAAGQGRRFAEQGYHHPKPLIDVQGEPMINVVLGNLKQVGHPIAILQREHVERYCADRVIRERHPATEIVLCDGITEGAACTVLRAKNLIDTKNELVLANSDQLVEGDLKTFLHRMRQLDADAGLLTFKSDNPKWSFAKVDSNGLVTRVAEKLVISDQASVGIYYYRHGSDFVRFAEQMIAKNVRVNGEFYVCPVFNEFIADGKRVYIHEIDVNQMHGLGTPEDLERFLAAYAFNAIVEVAPSISFDRPATGKTQLNRSPAADSKGMVLQ